MEDSDRDGEDLWDDEDIALIAVVQVVMNNNVAICDVLACHEQDVIDESVEDILRPNQDYRHLPRNPKAIFRHDEAFSCCCPQAMYISAIFIHLSCFLAVKSSRFIDVLALKAATKS